MRAHRTLRGILGGAATVLTAALLTACTPPGPAASPSPTAGTEAVLTFSDGADLDGGQDATWIDLFAGDAAASPVVPAPDGDGSWSYRLDDTECVVGYWQGDLSAAGADGADDETASDALLAAQFQTSTDDIADYLTPGVGLFSTVSSALQTSAVTGASDDGTYLIAARGLTALDRGFVASLTCPDDVEITSEWDALRAEGGFAVYFVEAPADGG